MALRIKNLSDFQHLLLSENKRIEAIEDERSEKVARWTNFGAISFSILIGVIALLLFRNVRQSRLANSSLIEQKEKLQKTLDELKSTQSQLIQSEKMASLGELTAGIAHEIQNPLNFVNNFSEVNAELIEEAQREAGSGNQDTLNELLGDIKANSEKITFHGNRADAIVKSMLQHSRKTSAQKELTDINALCDEYLRLSYHGLRAKDKSFNAEFDTKFDTTLPLVSVIPQDIARVILNLINNAFYAVNARQKMEQQGDYKPQVTISTRKEGNQLVIAVSDNGTGMTEQVKEKIFQPFFTTKPTGEGTGLGLSLSYDIVTKGHGGELRVETKEGVGTEFIIQLPIV
jgi:signal transduction histidine kinase